VLAKSALVVRNWFTSYAYNEHNMTLAVQLDMKAFLFFSVVLIVPWKSHGKNKLMYDIADERIDFGRRGLSESETLHFYALGDVPYTAPEWKALPLQVEALSPSADFVMHVGDLKVRSMSCRERHYTDFASIMHKSPVPVFNTIGDNDVVECANISHAYSLWHATFNDFDSHWNKPYSVSRQTGRKENFAFEHNNVFVIGLHVVHTIFDNAPMMYSVVEDSAAWWLAQERRMKRAKAVVIFAHTFNNQPKYHALRKALISFVVRNPEKPFLYIQGEKHLFVADNPIPGVDNFLRVVVDKGGIADPLEVLVDPDAEVPFKLKRRAYLSES
jgi:hypothetical protein